MEKEKIQMVIEIVCRHHHCTQSELFGKCKQRRLTDARKQCVVILRNSFQVKLKEIAGIMGLADHTTAIRHVKSHEIIAKCDSHYAKIYNEIFSDIKTQIKTSDIMADKYALMKYCYEAGKNGNKSWAQIEKEFKMALNAI